MRRETPNIFHIRSTTRMRSMLRTWVVDEWLLEYVCIGSGGYFCELEIFIPVEQNKYNTKVEVSTSYKNLKFGYGLSFVA